MPLLPPHMVERDGRYYARVVIPERHRKALGKREFTAALGGDKKEAKRKLPALVASFLDQIDAAERRRTPGARPRVYSSGELAHVHYSEELDRDDRVRDAGEGGDPIFSKGYADALKKIASGRADLELTQATIGWAIESFGAQKRVVPPLGSTEWRSLARTLAGIQLEVLARIDERDHGDFSGTPKHTLLIEAPEAPARRPIGVSDIFEGYRNELQKAGKGRDARKRWAPIERSLKDFLGHGRAGQIARRDVLGWKDELLKRFSSKTVRDAYLATCRAAFGWALDNDLIDVNPFQGIKLRVEKKHLTRERGFNDAEALALLRAARAYQAPSAREHATTVAAKCWTPFLAAYTGARIGELTQLRAEDVREKDGIPYIRITPEAGTVKTGEFRDVPLHPHLLELGFLEFVHGKKGPIFYKQTQRSGELAPARITADRVAAWVRSLNVVDRSVAPNHGWRHRVKTVGREAGIDSRILDALQGHAARTAGDQYGDVNLQTKHAAISKLPRYPILPTN